MSSSGGGGKALVAGPLKNNFIAASLAMWDRALDMSQTYLVEVQCVIGEIMLTILDRNSEIGAHVRSKLFYLIGLSHLIKSSQKSDLLSQLLPSMKPWYCVSRK